MQTTDERKIFACHISDSGLLSRMYREFLNTTTKNPNNLIHMRAKDFIDILPKKTYK